MIAAICELRNWGASHNLDAGIRMVFRGFNHTKTPMPRFAPRVTTASLLAFVAMAAAARPSCPRAPRRPNARSDCSTASSAAASASVAAAASAPVCGPDRTAQMSDSDLVLRLDRLETQIRQLTGRDRAAAVPQSAARRPAPPPARRHRLPLPGIEREGRARARRCNRVRKTRRRNHRVRPRPARPAGAAMRLIRRKIRTRPARRTRWVRSTLPALRRADVAMPW